MSEHALCPPLDTISNICASLFTTLSTFEFFLLLTCYINYLLTYSLTYLRTSWNNDTHCLCDVWSPARHINGRRRGPGMAQSAFVGPTTPQSFDPSFCDQQRSRRRPLRGSSETTAPPTDWRTDGPIGAAPYNYRTSPGIRRPSSDDTGTWRLSRSVWNGALMCLLQLRLAARHLRRHRELNKVVERRKSQFSDR